ncbi:MAG TPA: polysaccharide deacetylase family protein [Xanthobacteraceae bacterium]|jgi:peptidoglycan/xylan/chitin deacetylase (PgdA/CDA1 family)
MRSTIAAYALLASLVGIATAAAAECPEGALGVSRTIAVDPSEHARVGSMQYGESLPLRDHEVVLTFDDGPLPPYTTRVLDTLASECVKATFFLVGRMVRGYPSVVRRIYNDGHTIANHSQNHPFTFNKMTVDQAAQEIEQAHASLLSALGDEKAISPFFRVPGLLRGPAVEQYLAAHDYMTFSVDFLADDWTHINNREVARRAISRIEARGRGILLLHDIQPATALALPDILHELKARGFKIVHVVPAGAERPKTVTEPEQWVARRPRDQVWPRALVVGLDNPEAVELVAPSPESFGIEHFGGPGLKIALAQTFERPVAHDGEGALPSVAVWPRAVAYTVPADATLLPAPGAQNFRYAHPFRLGKPEKPKDVRKPHSKTAAKKSSSTASPTGKEAKEAKETKETKDGKETKDVKEGKESKETKEGDGAASPPPSATSSGDSPPRPPRAVGHQLNVARPVLVWPLWR